MSTSTEGVPIPSWDLADRLRKCLRVSGVGVQEMADYLEVSRNTVSAWVNGRVKPQPRDIRLWALRTGLPFEWVRDGTDPQQRPDPDGESWRNPWGPNASTVDEWFTPDPLRQTG